MWNTGIREAYTGMIIPLAQELPIDWGLSLNPSSLLSNSISFHDTKYDGGAEVGSALNPPKPLS